MFSMNRQLRASKHPKKRSIRPGAPTWARDLICRWSIEFSEDYRSRSQADRGSIPLTSPGPFKEPSQNEELQAGTPTAPPLPRSHKRNPKSYQGRIRPSQIVPCAVLTETSQKTRPPNCLTAIQGVAEAPQNRLSTSDQYSGLCFTPRQMCAPSAACLQPARGSALVARMSNLGLEQKVRRPAALCGDLPCSVGGHGTNSKTGCNTTDKPSLDATHWINKTRTISGCNTLDKQKTKLSLDATH